MGTLSADDPAQREDPEIGDGIRLLAVRHLGPVGLQRPADEGCEAAGPALQIPHAKQMFHPIGVGLAQSIHHGHRGLHALAVGLFLNAQPLLGLGLLPGDPLPYLVDQDLTATPRNAVQPRGLELAHHVGHREPKALAEEHHLGRREAMDVDRVMPLDVAHQVQIPLEGDVGVVAALKQDLHPADGLALVNLPTDLLVTQDVPLVMLGPAVERAELAIGHAHVGVVDVPVDDVGDDVLRVQPPALGVRQAAQLEQAGPLVKLEIVPELAGGAIDGHQAAVMKESDPSGTRPSAARRRKKSVSPARWRYDKA